MKIFIGYDRRQTVAFQVLAHSIWKRASKPVSITRLDINQLPLRRKGLTEFTYSRYLVPYLCNYEGKALFMDADMLCLSDITQLFDIDPFKVNVVMSKHQYEWPSLMLFNNAECRELTPEFIETGSPQKWIIENAMGIQKNWNHIVPYDGLNPDAKIVHYTQGIPCFEETKNCEYATHWQKEAQECMSTVSWEAIMGNSVHKELMGL